MGTKARGSITLYNVKNGKDAEYHRLRPQSEKAVVGGDNSLYITLSYIIEHVNGAQVTTEAGSAQGYHVTARMNNGVSIAMTHGAVNSGTYKLTDYSKAQNRPDYVIIELRDSADKVVDIRTAQIIMEASSYVDIVADLRRTVSQQGSSISSVQQDAKSLTLKVESMKNGVRNLLKGGRLGVTSSQYGFGAEKIEDRWVKLKPDTDYTLTVCGRISGNAKANGQELRVYLFNRSDTDSTKEWTWQNVVRIGTEEDSVESIVVHTPSAGDRRRPTNDQYMVLCYPYPDQESNGRNGEVTVNWVTVTEGSQAASDWIPSKEESGEERVKTVEARLENGEFRVKSDRTVFVDGNGKETVLIKDGKLSAELIDAVKLVAAGLQAGNIDAKNATIKNLKVEGNSVFKGRLEGTSGSFTDLTCVDDKGQVVAGLHFSPDGKMVFDGDISSQGGKTINGRSRSLRYYASDIWCRGQFGHYSRICAVIKDNMMFVHHGGHEYTNGVKIKLASTRTRDGREVYLIPLYSPGLPSAKRNGEEVVDYDNPKIYELYSNSYGRKIAEELELPAGASIDVVVFNCTSYHLYNFVGMGYGKQWTVINGNDNVEAWICCHGSDFKVDGGWNLNCCYINPDWLTPSTVDRNSLGAGVMVGKELDMNW